MVLEIKIFMYYNMTYSILARDPKTGTIGGVATTGSYCVGGWVLRGDVKIGMSASQGASASTILGDQMLAQMNAGEKPDVIIQAVQQKDQGLEYRQSPCYPLKDKPQYILEKTMKVSLMTFMKIILLLQGIC